MSESRDDRSPAKGRPVAPAQSPITRLTIHHAREPAQGGEGRINNAMSKAKWHYLSGAETTGAPPSADETTGISR